MVSKGLTVAQTVNRTTSHVFTPGPVIDLPAPASPMEASKLDLHGIELDDKGHAKTPFGPVLPLMPLGRLFALVV